MRKNKFENYECEHQLSFRTIDMEIKEDEEWKTQNSTDSESCDRNGCPRLL